MKSSKVCAILLTLSLYLPFVSAQTGSVNEPVRYVGGEIDNPNTHDGSFRYAIGVENIQVMRANRTHPEMADGYGWTYNHAPNITYWNGNFYLQYLSNPKDEQQPPGHTLIVTSKDGRNWSKPVVAFPEYKAPLGVEIPKGYTGYIMHQRMGFYTAPNGRLLTVAFYGHSYNPFKEGGIGRVVREIHKDGSFGPIYFIRYSSHTYWNESDTSYPFYTASKDKGFIVACDALLKDKLKTLQWNDEDRSLDGFCALKDSVNTVEALSYYHRRDGKVVALWKKSFAGLSNDNGLSWSKPVKVPTLIMAGGKNWGQRTKDGRYAMCYNPIATQPYRYPLIVISGNDGIVFDDMGVVHGEVPPRRFYGENKDFGPCYVRGITEGEALPPGNDMWLAYSVNKEDIWVSRIPLPIKIAYQGEVNDDFNGLMPGEAITNWNTYSPQWAKVSIAEFPSKQNKSLRLEDSDAYDYARAIRVFQTSKYADISFKCFVEQPSDSTFQIDVTDRYGNQAFSMSMLRDSIYLKNGFAKKVVGRYDIKRWNTFSIRVSTEGLGTCSLYLNDRELLKDEPLNETVKSVERISFRTGEYRCLPNRTTPNQQPCDPLAGCDTQIEKAVYYIDDVIIK
jgi:hypothetical protein